MQTHLLLTALIGISISGGTLSGGSMERISAMSYLTEPPLIEEVIVIEESYLPEEDIYIEESELEDEVVMEMESEEIVEESVAVIESEPEEPLTFDQVDQNDVAEVESIQSEVSEEEAVEGPEKLGLAAIIAAYGLSDYDFFMVSTPSSNVYQYEFYADSPDGTHVNLIGIYQYDATEQQTFHMNPLTGVWE